MHSGRQASYLIAAAGANREATHVAIVHIFGGKDVDMDFVDADVG